MFTVRVRDRRTTMAAKTYRVDIDSDLAAMQIAVDQFLADHKYPELKAGARASVYYSRFAAEPVADDPEAPLVELPDWAKPKAVNPT